DTLVRRGTFKEELFYKLSAAAIYLPPLRERREDIPMISEHLVQKYSSSKGKKIIGISHDALNAMLQNNWNNNIQELENLIERIVVLKNSGSIEITDLPPRLRNLVTDNVDAFYDRANHLAKNQNQQINTYQGNSLNQHNNSYHQNNNLSGMNTNQTGMNYSSAQSMPMGNNFLNQNSVSQRQSSMGNFNQSNNPLQSQPHYTNRSQMSHAIPNHLRNNVNVFDEMPCEIDQFIKKDIDLGSGIDFYRVVEEFENKLIAEALRRTNHNKNRAAQLLSMNRTTLVEKLKKRASSSTKMETGRVKRNSAFTIFDGLGDEGGEFDGIDFVNLRGDEIG
ncbi:MAG: hypothetical protein K2X39_00830, partial [Silvanigrellaceae bacterium]|nr:hypothetical protein [Silvanigrellaceae bacterium]